jgi:hypothetical protein
MVDAKVALVLLTVGLAVYGARAGGHAVVHVFKEAGQVVTQPIRHPMKDVNVIANVYVDHVQGKPTAAAKWLFHKVSGR